MFVVYVLRSIKTGRFYIGLTSDLERRLREHNEGLSRSTKHGRPWELVHREDFPTLAEAVRRERYLKTGRGREELQRLLAQKQYLA
jgi:putative endonuclease